MELTTKILNVSDKSDEKRSFQLWIDGKQEWASFWYSSKSGDVPPDVVSVVKGLKKDDECTFDLFQSGKWWNINSIVPAIQIRDDAEPVSPMEGFEELDPERQATELAEKDSAPTPIPNSFNSCNAMNASANLMNVIIEVYGAEMKPDELFKLHQDILSGGVMKGARLLVKEYY